MKVPYNPPLERQVTRNWVHMSPFSSPPPPIRAGWAETHYLPPQGIPLPQGNYPSRTSLGENFTSASKSGSEVTFLTQDDSKEHFWLNGTSLQGQTAEIETSAGWTACFSIALLCGNQAGPVQPGQIHGRPVRDRSLSKESLCTFSSLSINTRRWPHLQTHREETLQRDHRKNRLLRRLAG